MTKIRWVLVIVIILVAIIMAGFRLSQPEPEIVAAASAPEVASLVKTEDLKAQVTTVEEVKARLSQSGVGQVATFADEQSGFHLSYPLNWEQIVLSSNVTLFQSPDGASKVRVEAVGPLPADGLTPFVDRSLGNDIIYSRQMLTVHGLPAERVVGYSEGLGSQTTTFFINQDGQVFVVTGTGDQMSIEMIARSFNAPQMVAQR